MKLVISLIICGTLVLPLLADPEEEERCYHDETKHYWPVGEKYIPPGHCYELTCDKPHQYTGLTCPSMDDLNRCTYIPYDNSKKYPACCDHFVCE